jgi:multiple sugar transport system permease protein
MIREMLRAIQHRRFLDRTQKRRLIVSAVSTVVFKTIMYVFLISISYILLYPILYSISTAFRESIDMYDPNVSWIPTTFTVNNFTTIWEKIDYPSLFRNTVFLCGISAVLQTAVCALTGYGFARFHFREKGILGIVLLVTIILPPQVASIPNFLMMKDFDVFGVVRLAESLIGKRITINLIDSAGAYFLPAVFGLGLRSGLFIMIFRQFFKGLPVELEDAAYVDGCGPLHTFLKVMMPNSKPPIVIVFLFSVVFYWNDTYYGFMYMDEFQTISVRLSQISADMMTVIPNFIGDPTQAIPYIQSGVLMSIVPLLILYIACQKIFIESVERAGIVG